MARARRKEPNRHLGAASLIVAGWLVVAGVTLWLVTQSHESAQIEITARETVRPDPAPALASPASWSVQTIAPLFGLQSEPVAGQVGAKWRPVAADIEAELEVLARCRAGEPCPAVAQELLKIVQAGADHDGLARVGRINRAVDLAIIATSDETQWGVADHWSPPFETLASHRGDCEDYAILKYAALLAAGVSRDDVKIVILHNVLPDEDHAVAAARVDGAWLLLDNSRLTLVRDTDMVGALPRFVLDEHGARRFVAAASRGSMPWRAMRRV